jgi:hypothetical protein
MISFENGSIGEGGSIGVSSIVRPFQSSIPSGIQGDSRGFSFRGVKDEGKFLRKGLQSVMGRKYEGEWTGHTGFAQGSETRDLQGPPQHLQTPHGENEKKWNSGGTESFHLGRPGFG